MTNANGKKVNDRQQNTTMRMVSGKSQKVTLYDADPECKHEQDPNCWSGIKCKKCTGWFCI